MAICSCRDYLPPSSDALSLVLLILISGQGLSCWDLPGSHAAEHPEALSLQL